MDEIDTSRFGRIRIEPGKIIRMPRGMPGFPGIDRFVLLRHKDDSPLFWFQSVQNPEVAFVMVDPRLVLPDYRLENQRVLKEMDWKEEHLLQTFVILNVPKKSPGGMTANLIAPVIINASLNEAIQAVFPDLPYSHRHPVATRKKGSNGSP